MPVPGGTTLPTGLPSNWESLPTTYASLQAAVNMVSGQYGAGEGGAFQAWYLAAWEKDPSLTPDQAIATFGLGSTLQAGIGQTGTLLGQVPAAVADAASNTTGVKAAGALSSAWDAATALPRFLSMLTSANLWIRVGEVVAGLILFGIGVNALFKGKPMATVTNVAGKVAPLAMA